MADLYEYSTPAIVRLMGTRFQGLQDALRAHPKRCGGAVRHRIDHHPQIRERSGGQTSAGVSQFSWSIRLCFTRD